MNRKILLILCFCGFLSGGGFAFASPPGQSVADSLRTIYVSVEPAGNNFIVDQGKWEVLFDKNGMPLTDFKYERMFAGLCGNVIAYDNQGCRLLDTQGNFLFKFDHAVNYTDTIHHLYRYYSKDGKATGTVYNESGTAVLQYYDSKTCPLGLCRVSDGYTAGIKDTFGQTILPQIYAKIRISEWGFSALKNDTAYIFSKKGKLKFSTPAQDIQMLRQGILATKMNGLWRLKDSTGKSLTPFKYRLIKEIKNGNYIETYEDILDYKGNEVAHPGFHNSLFFENGWYAISYPNKFGDELWNEHFNRVFNAGEYEEADFLGIRFIRLKKDYNDTATLIYDREKGKFSKLKIEGELPGDAYLLEAKDTLHRFILRGNKKLKFPYFTNIHPVENSSFLLLDSKPKNENIDNGFYNSSRPVDLFDQFQSFPPYGITDTSYQLILPLKYSTIQVLNKRLIAAWDKEHNLFCLVNEKGKKILALKDASTKVEKRQSLTGIGTKDKYFLIDSVGNILSSGKYPPSPLYPDLISEAQPAMPRLMLRMDSSGYYGLYDLKGRQLLPHEYYPVTQQMKGVYSLKKKDSIYFVNNNGLLLYRGKGFPGRDYHILKSYSILFKNEQGKWGVWDAMGKELLPFEYDTAGMLGDMGYFIGKGNRYTLLDNYGRPRYPLQDWLPKRKLAGRYYQDSAAHLYVLKNKELTPLKTIPERLKNRYIDFGYRKIANIAPDNILGIPSGIYNRSLQRIAPYNPNYSSTTIEHNKITISDSTGKNTALIDTNGKMLIPFFPTPDLIRINDSQVFAAYKTGKAFCFQRINGKFISFPVTLAPKSATGLRGGNDRAFGGKLIFIRPNGSKGVVNENGSFLWDSLVTGIAPKDNFYLIKKAGKWGLMKYDLQYIQPPTADSIAAFNDNFLIFSNGLQGLYNKDFRTYIPPVYENVYQPSSLRNNFLVVKQNGHFGIIDQYGKALILGMDSISPAYTLTDVIAYKNGSAMSVSLNDDGSIRLEETKNIPRRSYNGIFGDVVITRNKDHYGLYSNITFKPILPETYDAIDRLNDYFVAWKYKPDKHQGIDSTVLVSETGKVLMWFKGWRNLASEKGYLYINGVDSSPVLKDDSIIIPGGYKILAFRDSKFFIVAKEGREGTISPEGRWLIPLFQGTIEDTYLRDYKFWLGRIIPKQKSKKEKYFLITPEGKRRDKKNYAAISFKDDGSILYTKGKKRGYLKKAEDTPEE